MLQEEEKSDMKENVLSIIFWLSTAIVDKYNTYLVNKKKYDKY